jgi:hypothetical protein
VPWYPEAGDLLRSLLEWRRFGSPASFRLGGAPELGGGGVNFSGPIVLQWHLMERREFVKQMGLGLAAGWALGRLAWPFSAGAGGPELRLALLADAHLKDGNRRRPEAAALARAVAEIRGLWPAPELVLFAGDLAHRGRPDALDLGREILGDLPGPCWAVRGEGDHGPGGEAAWVRRWGESRFSRAWRGFHFLGLDTGLRGRRGGPVFAIGAEQRRWLARELAALSPDTPLIILSHAPLRKIFHPWQQWTDDGAAVAPLLARFQQVWCIHGHVHGVETGGRGQGPGVGNGDPGGHDLRGWSLSQTHLALPATAWPRPVAVQGTPAVGRPGSGPRGCGWGLAILSNSSRHFQPYLWRA